MSSVILELKKIIKSDAIICDGTQSSHAIIEERNEAKLKKLTISDLQPHHLIIGLDDARKLPCDSRVACMSPVFSTTSTYDINRACDALLIEEKEVGECKITYIELKSDHPSGFEGQFASSTCFVSYLKELLKKFSDINLNLISEKFIIFHTDTHNANRSLNKTTTIKKPIPANANSLKNPKKIIVRNDETKRFTEL